MNKLHITRRNNEIKIDLNTEVPSVSVTDEVPTSTNSIPITDTTTEETTIEETTSNKRNETSTSKPFIQSTLKTKGTRPKKPCPCSTKKTTTRTTTATTTKKKPRMPCPCVPIAHNTTTTTASTTSTTPTTPIDTTQELSIRRSSIYETPNTAEALVETTTMEQEYNCTTIDTTSATEMS